MWNRGKIIIVAMFGVALCAASFAAWYQYHGQQGAHDFWGTTSALLISEAPQVEVLRLGESGPLKEPASQDQSVDDEPATPTHVEFGDRSWPVLSTKPAQAAPGIKNIRRALVLDTTFDWKSPPLADEPDWQYALGFTDNRNWATILFDFETGRVALTGAKKTARLDPAASRDLQKFFAEQFVEATSDGSSDSPAETNNADPKAQSSVEPAKKPVERSAEGPEEKRLEPTIDNK